MPCWRHVHFSIGSRHRDARPTAPQLLHSRLSAIAKCSSNGLDKGGTDGRTDGWTGAGLPLTRSRGSYRTLTYISSHHETDWRNWQGTPGCTQCRRQSRALTRVGCNTSWRQRGMYTVLVAAAGLPSWCRPSRQTTGPAEAAWLWTWLSPISLVPSDFGRLQEARRCGAAEAPAKSGNVHAAFPDVRRQSRE